MRSKSYWAGDFLDSKNTAVRFSFNGYDFLIINIEYMANNATITWMKNLLDNNKGANVIVGAHTYLNKAGGYGFSSVGLPGEVAWCTNLKNILNGYPSIFLTVSGHDPTGTANRTRVGNREEIFFDRQGIYNQTGAAAVRIYTFNLTSLSVNASTYAYNLTANKWSWLTDAYNRFSFNTALKSNDWVLENNARTVKGCPDLREYVWVKNATLPPNAAYDKIGLHRLVKTGITPKGVIFMAPGIYGSGEQLISPQDSNYSIDESSNQLVYWANRGFDVYSIDWRAHFLPLTMNMTEASAMAVDWGWTQYINDMKEAVDKTKEVSGNNKIFLAGMSWGAAVSLYYGSQYWNQDLKGLILLDGGENTIKSTNTTNKFNLTNAVKALASTGGMAYENPRRSQTSIPPSGMIFAYQNALQNPGAPAEWPIGTPLQPTINPLTNKAWTNISEYIAYQQYSTNFSNIYNGYGNLTVTMQRMAAGDRYWPTRLGIESTAFHDWNNCPYIQYDYDDHYKEINVPVLAVRSELYGIPSFGNYVNGLATSDFTQIVLPKYGHLDTYIGTYSAKDVSEPAYQWMLAHTLKVSTSVASTTALTGVSAIFSVSASGGPQPYSYQWYEGNTILSEQTAPLLVIAKNATGTYSYQCSVTDAIGMTTNSTAVTVTVSSTPTNTPNTSPISSPTSTPTSTPTPIVSPTPTQIPTIPPSTSASDTNPETATVIIITAIALIGAVLAFLLIQKGKQKKA